MLAQTQKIKQKYVVFGQRMPFHMTNGGRERHGGSTSGGSSGVTSSMATLSVSGTQTGVLAHTDTVATNRVCAHFAGDVSCASTIHANEQVATDVFVRSDVRTKDNIRPLEGDVIHDLVPVSYTTKDTGRDTVGFVAQSVETLDPRLIKKDKRGMLSLDYRAISVHNVHAVQKLLKDYQSMKQEIAELRKERGDEDLPVAIPVQVEN